MPSLDVDGATLSYETHGSGWPLVLLHGAWLDHELWAPQVERFTDEFRVVTPDLRCHGDSVVDDSCDVSSSQASGGSEDEQRESSGVERMADDVATLCDELGLDNPVVCGLSLGGLVVQQLALDRSDRIAGVVLADTVTSIPPVPGPEAVRRLLFPTGPARLLTRAWGPGAYFRWLLATVEATHGRWLALDDDARAYALECIDRYDADRFLQVLEAFYEHRPRDLSTLDVPTLLLHGDREAPSVVAQNRELERTIPDARRTVLPDACHLANRDNPAAFGDALADFLDARVPVPT